MVRDNKMLISLLLATGIFNILDYFFTLKVIGMGFEEANPIIDAILFTPLFPLYKLIVVPLLLAFIWFVRDKAGKRVKLYAATVFAAYLFLMIYFGRIFLFQI